MEEKAFKEFVINRKIAFSLILEKAGIKVSYQGNLFCPFHENTVTPAAKLYKDEDGDKIFCFAERKMYKPVDVIKRGMINISVDTLFSRVWGKLGEDEKEKLKQDFGKPVSIFPEGWNKIEEELVKFEKGEIDIDELLCVFINRR